MTTTHSVKDLSKKRFTKLTPNSIPFDFGTDNKAVLKRSPDVEAHETPTKISLTENLSSHAVLLEAAMRYTAVAMVKQSDSEDG